MAVGRLDTLWVLVVSERVLARLFSTVFGRLLEVFRRFLAGIGLNFGQVERRCRLVAFLG